MKDRLIAILNLTCILLVVCDAPSLFGPNPASFSS
uniref:Uncharacterized protein n=1 Tax=Rhizophora mucronata TaxID=61149 RepID=A0A2P2M2H4_RHIMU